MHSFKVVRYKTSDSTLISAIPHQWESNSILRWPAHMANSKVDVLRSSVASMPEESWEIYPCTVKAINISTFKEAVQMEQMLNIIGVETTESSNHEREVELKNSLKPIKVYLENVMQKVNQVKEEINEIKISNEKLSSELKELLKTLMSLGNQNSRIHEIFSENLANDENCMKKFTFPLKTCEEVAQLENEINSNPEFKKQLITIMSRVAGTSGQENGTRVAYKVIDRLFRSELLTLYSWTGMSRSADFVKKPFNELTGILSVFFEVIFLADNRHTAKRNEAIFKEGALKHSAKRNSRKRTSSQGSEFRIESSNSGTENSVKITKIASNTIPDYNEIEVEEQVRIEEELK